MTDTESKTEKLVVIATHGVDDAPMATIPFVMASAAVAMDVETTVVLQGSGVTLATKGFYDHVFASGFPPLKELVDAFVELGGRILVCIPCLEERKIAPDSLVDGAELAKAGKVVSAALEADSTMSY